MTLLSILLLGFFLGMRHATDSDHVIAITTIVSRQRKIFDAALTGIFWGIGHSLTLLVVGGAIILFGIVIPERVGMSLEFCVALMLTVLGLFNLRGFKNFSHSHAHQHGDYVHSHPHARAEEEVPTARLDHLLGKSKIYLALRPLIIGIVHGLAGSAAVALLVLPIIRDPILAVCYLLIFGVGTIAGMMLITAAISVPVAYSARRFQFFNRWIGVGAGALSLCFGVFLIYQIGFIDGLFTR